MLQPRTLFLLCLGFPALVQSQLPLSAGDRYEVTFVKDRRALPDEVHQARLRSTAAWTGFLAQHPGWRVEFNEVNGKPHQAYGAGISTAGATPGERATAFLASIADAFHFSMSDLVMRPVRSTAKHHIVRFDQRHVGLEVLFARAQVKMDLQGRVISFMLDVYDLPAEVPAQVMDDAQLIAVAAAGVDGQIQSSITPEAAWLALPNSTMVEYGTVADVRLVREVTVKARGAGVPADLHCLVDAVSGELLYRTDRVHTEHYPGKDEAGADVTFTGTVSHTIPQPSAVEPLRNLNFIADGQNFSTDANGSASTGITGPISFTAPLSGQWGTVFTDGATPTLTGTLQEGANEVSFDGGATEQETSAFFHVNNIHDHVVATLPGFTGMDYNLDINVDLTSGDCNAFYDGSSINFYAEANDCYTLAIINDVVYHEYGHGINDNYYQDNGSSFNNGAMNEGYADVWAFSLSLNPILAEGYQISTPAAYIRRYDAAPKVYPVDIVGEVHADGEIIAGAWWDTFENLGSMEQTMDLFALAFEDLQAEAVNGQEGTAFRDVLLSTLQADDDDADLLNGTPNGQSIADAFAEHGITLLSGFDVQHTPVDDAPAVDGITIEATASVSGQFDIYVQGVQLSYRINTGAWQQMMMTNVGGDNYEAVIPGQPVGTVISYYIGLLDVGDILSGVTPIAADQADPNLPHYILVGYDLQLTDNADNVTELGDWELGMPGDNNTTGTWELFQPNPTYSTVDNSVIQTGSQHTPGGEFCFYTANGSDENAPGEADVDAGHTTLQGDPIDLSAYENPTFTLYRWYTNSPPGGANPGADWWYVQISNNGTDWVFVENTQSDDRSWRRLAFRVQDYLPETSPVTLRFIASDSTHLGQTLDGGSLVEAAVDDIQVWDNTIVGIGEDRPSAITALYPDPASDIVNVVVNTPGGNAVTIEILDPAGRIVLSEAYSAAGRTLRTALDVGSLSAGGYVLRARWSSGSVQERFSIVR